MGLFDVETGDPAYLNVRNGITTEGVRAAMREAWGRVSKFCPEGPERFESEFRKDFISRAWELFLMGVLDAEGFELVKPPGEAPDICIKLTTGLTVWIEAIAPKPGDSADAPFQRPPGRWVGALYPEPKLLLRYTSALEEKFRKLKGYRDKSIVSQSDALIIAVFQGGILDADLHDVTLPSIAKALFSFGEEYLSVIPYSDEPPAAGIERRAQVSKMNKADVPTNFFFEPKTDIISAVLYGDTFMRSKWSAEDSIGIIHRPDALVPVPIGTLPRRCEMWVDKATGELTHEGRCARHGIYSKPREIPEKPENPPGGASWLGRALGQVWTWVRQALARWFPRRAGRDRSPRGS